MVASAMNKTGDVRREAQEALSLTMAKRSAIAYGQVLSMAEMEQLLKDLFATKSPARTPDGQIVYTVVDDKMMADLM